MVKFLAQFSFAWSQKRHFLVGENILKITTSAPLQKKRTSTAFSIPFSWSAVPPLQCDQTFD
jgi:hypothetical protein